VINKKAETSKEAANWEAFAVEIREDGLAQSDKKLKVRGRQSSKRSSTNAP
jgi:hypothetical protein